MNNRTFNYLLLAILGITLQFCSQNPGQSVVSDSSKRPDPHSFSNHSDVIIKHINLDLSVDFNQRILQGYAELEIEYIHASDYLALDSRDLNITKVLGDGKEVAWNYGDSVSFLGRELLISLKEKPKKIKIYYATSPEAQALQWLNPEQTHDKKLPFLFTQSQAILARTWVPCQDAPGVKFTYKATIRTQPKFLALMSAENDTTRSKDGVYRFKMPQSISSYLLALAVGDLRFKPLGPNSGVYAEPGFLEACVSELRDIPSMIDSAESLYGPYPFGRYDVLVLPPSFPFGGMENPRLTFATPTIIAGDRSLVSLIAHELAHSWSGNLVTNATWNDFWLNEGFTVYFEQRIMEKIYGSDYANMLSVLGFEELQNTLKNMKEKPEDTRLNIDLKGRDPDEGLTDIAYEKGRFFLNTLEQWAGRSRFDSFLRNYFNSYAFSTISNPEFRTYLKKHLIQSQKDWEDLKIDVWLDGTGLPDNCFTPVSTTLNDVLAQSEDFLVNPVNKPETAHWTTHHWLHFLRNLDRDSLRLTHMQQLDTWFDLSNSNNAEIACDWYRLSIKTNYKRAYVPMEAFLLKVGRRKFLMPLYKALMLREEDRMWAKAVFDRAKSSYHSVSANSIEELFHEQAL